MLKILSRAVLSKSILPVNLILHVTSRCNCSCKFCFVKKKITSGMDDLNLSEIKKISKYFKKLIWLNISGGEPFIREDLEDICFMFYENSRPEWLSIPTNGSFPSRIKIMCDSLLRKINIPLSIEISIDGIGELHDMVRNFPGAFNCALETYSLLKALKKKYRNLYLKVITVVNNENIDYLENIIKYVRKNMSDIFLHTFIFARSAANKNDLVLVNKDKLFNKKAILMKTAEVSNNTSVFPDIVLQTLRQKVLEINLRTLQENRQIIPCLADKVDIVIWPNGDVSFCERGTRIGNLRDCDFHLKELLCSDNGSKIRKQISKEKCFCTHECAVLDSILFNITLYPSIAFEIIKNLTKNIL